MGDVPGSPGAETPSSQGSGPRWTPGQGTRSHLPQLRVQALWRKVPRAATESQGTHVNKYFLKKKDLKGQG